MEKKIFTSRISWDDAIKKAMNAGFKPIGKGRNQYEFVVFGRR